MHSKGTVRAAIAVVFLCTLLSVVGAAQAALVIYYGADDGAGPGDPRPLSDAAAANFNAAAGPTSLITFEGLPLGTAPILLPGVTVTITNSDPNPANCPGICTTDQHSNTGSNDWGYNTTAGGTTHLRVTPLPLDATGETVTFSFSSPIDSFGAYLTDTQSTFPGSISLTFDNGTAQTRPITKNNSDGGVLFFGFTDIGGLPITSVSYNSGSTLDPPPGLDADYWGIDDVRFAPPIQTSPVPEPATALLLATGGVAVLWARRRPKA